MLCDGLGHGVPSQGAGDIKAASSLVMPRV
jgi:hypothetical protein